MPIMVAAPESGPAPFTVDARVREEDRWLVLSAPPRLPESSDHPIQVFTGLLDAEPAALGTVVVQDGKPLQLLAVVHDLDREPSVSLADVESALAAVVTTCAERGVQRLALPLLGVRHGRIAKADVLDATARVLAGTMLGALWLVTDEPQDLEALRARWPT